ncbi:E3 ubiquitin-protein ligase MARCH6 [Apostasia shenzhenica]|uniref:E3 ubiquitin-protein ligase MARCH6 n=1 Tax=Apostasia shenzhenica TaxID=1088818 RepID=A0A2I0AI25_9ASPA|nr:E3 ubiquitin-protein ligase MARCH6 [Apostasia shenzhenica]
MESGDDESFRLLVEGFESIPFPSSASSSSSSSSSSSIYLCRICHEEEEQSSSSMESPCSCSGTLKFAHRRCIQRWCDEKQSTVCEICLQKFEPNYSVTSPSTKAHLIDVVVTIRGSLEVPRFNYEPQNPSVLLLSSRRRRENGDGECSETSSYGASYCRLVALMFTVLLLVRHLFAVLSASADDYAFTLVTVFFLRAMGILLPFYLVLRLINAIQKAQIQQQLNEFAEVSPIERV